MPQHVINVKESATAQVTAILRDTVQSDSSPADSNLRIFSQVFPLISCLNLGSLAPVISLFTELLFLAGCLRSGSCR